MARASAIVVGASGVARAHLEAGAGHVRIAGRGVFSCLAGPLRSNREKSVASARRR